MNPNIFREYDIRGVVEKDFAGTVVETLGRGMGTYLRNHGKKRITLGRDVRLSSDRLRDDLLRGLVQTGLHVIDIGVCPTPLLYFSIRHLETDGGIMITGSHNPAEFNGFKVCMGPDTIYGEEIQKVRRIIEAGTFAEGNGSTETLSVLPAYLDVIRSGINIQGPLKVVLDAGNGTAGLVAPDLVRSLGCEVICLYCDPDGRFPNHHPDPTIPRNLEDLRKTVLKEKAHVGISFDGDADRIGALDEKGEIIWGDRLLVLFSRFLLAEHPGACIISEVKCSKVLAEDIRRHGGRPIMWKAGHSLIKGKMKQEKALLAGEMSGHMFFADRYFGFDDAIYAACRLLEILGRQAKCLSELLSDLPTTYSTPEIRVDCPDEVKFLIVDKVKEYCSKHYQVIDVDGVRIVFSDGWGLLRASNTQPVLVMRFEADTETRLQEIRDLVEARVTEIRAAMA